MSSNICATTNDASDINFIQSHIRDVPNFPKDGIIFKDIMPLLKSNDAFLRTINMFCNLFEYKDVDTIACMESRGFLFASAMAYKLNKGLLPIRKPGKLPCKTISESYSLEYGTNTLEIQENSLFKGERVLLVDDVLATGGTAKAAGNLVTKAGGVVSGYAFLMELSFLKGRELLADYKVRSIITY